MAKAKTKRKPNPAFMKPMKPDAALAKVVGPEPKPRTEVNKNVVGECVLGCHGNRGWVGHAVTHPAGEVYLPTHAGDGRRRRDPGPTSVGLTPRQFMNARVPSRVAG